MKTKVSYLILLVALLASACSPGAVATNQTVEPPVTQSAEIPPAAPQDEQPTAVAPAEAPSVETAVPVDVAYPIVDTGQTACYNANGAITCPTEGEAFYGQDAQFTGNTPSYTDNGDGTITDNVTGLIWQQSADTDGDGNIDAADKRPYEAAGTYCENLSLAGYDDWQLPDIKQLYSLIDFGGLDPSGYNGADTSGLVPFIDTNYFDFAYGDTDANERIIDSQYASSTLYVSTAGERLLFGVNFADGRIKGYGLSMRGQDKTFTVLCTRENSSYGVNDFLDNGDGAITDNATGLMWAQNDSGSDVPTGLNWEEALAWVEAQNDANYLGYSDWRLPNVKELQSILDYSRSPDTTGSAAIDPLFNVTTITNEAGQTDYPFYWSSTTHANFANGLSAAYVAFGRSLGYMGNSWIDVHGAGSQRSDPKTGDPADWPTGHGPQGDAIRIYNYARCVRGGEVTLTPDGDSTASRAGLTVESTGSSQPMQPGGQPGPGGQPPNGNQQPGVMPGQPSQSGPGGQPPQPGVQPGQQNGQSGQPPQEAIAACSGLSENATCEVITPRGTLSGTCMLVQSQLACVPQGGPPPGAP